MKFQRILPLLLFLAAVLAGCGSTADTQPEAALTFTDDMGYEVTLESWDRVVSLNGSFAETWVLAGGTLVRTTQDAVEERNLDVGDDLAIVGTVQNPNLEEIFAADPDFVILSSETAEHLALHDALTDAGIPHAYYQVTVYQEYLSMLRQFCDMTGRDDLYAENGEKVEAQIDAVLDKIPSGESPSVLLVRTYSTGAKCKGDDNLAGAMLKDLGADNLVSRYDSLLEELSMEEIIAADPDYIFLVPMGDETAALSYMAENFESNPAWSGLTAVKNGNYILLPKDLFQYKPNARWGESYEYLAEILYPDI